MLISFRFFSIIIAVFSCFLSLSAAPDEKLYGIRDRDTPPGLYESSYNDPSRGRKLTENLDEASIRAYFEAQKSPSEAAAFDLESAQKLETPERTAAPNRPILYVVGLPLFGQERTEVLGLVKSLSGAKKQSFKSWLTDLFYFDKKNPETHIRPIGRPTGKWKLLQQLAYTSIWPVDLVPVTKEVMRHGVQSVIISSSIGLTVQLMVQIGEQGHIAKALAIVIPAAIINLAQSAWTSIPRNWWQNYFRRSEQMAAPLVESFVTRSKVTDKVSRIVGSIVEQIWLTAFFTFNVYVAGRGDLKESLRLLSPSGVWEFAKKKWPSMFTNIIWRTPAENAIADYAELESKNGRGKEADIEAAKIRKIMTIVATNLWVYSTLTTMNWEALGAKWNLGHLGLAVLAGVGITAWIKPKILRKFTRSGRCADKLVAMTSKP